MRLHKIAFSPVTTFHQGQLLYQTMLGARYNWEGAITCLELKGEKISAADVHNVELPLVELNVNVALDAVALTYAP
jgi:hypothetical protein